MNSVCLLFIDAKMAGEIQGFMAVDLRECLIVILKLGIPFL